MRECHVEYCEKSRRSIAKPGECRRRLRRAIWSSPNSPKLSAYVILFIVLEWTYRGDLMFLKIFLFLLPSIAYATSNADYLDKLHSTYFWNSSEYSTCQYEIKRLLPNTVKLTIVATPGQEKYCVTAGKATYYTCSMNQNYCEWSAGFYNRFTEFNVCDNGNLMEHRGTILHPALATHQNPIACPGIEEKFRPSKFKIFLRRVSGNLTANEIQIAKFLGNDSEVRINYGWYTVPERLVTGTELRKVSSNEWRYYKDAGCIKTSYFDGEHSHPYSMLYYSYKRLVKQEDGRYTHIRGYCKLNRYETPYCYDKVEFTRRNRHLFDCDLPKVTYFRDIHHNSN